MYVVSSQFKQGNINYDLTHPLHPAHLFPPPPQLH